MTARLVLAKFIPPAAGRGWCCLKFDCGHELLDETRKTPSVGEMAECPQCALESERRVA